MPIRAYRAFAGEQIGGNASWFAGGMPAPWCERKSAEHPVLDLGRDAADW
ncbi:hypothetical protein X737_27660 [Mesorhizobium sp. L48C026A00]|nr:hypothetical protein X737_27660 [Mesorhizobium sp. L48C026A00]